MKKLACLFLLSSLVLLGGCAVNPVTGERELSLISETEEINIGRTQYVPSRQIQGGDYNLDPELTRYVESVGQSLAVVSERWLPYEFVIINDSTPNAWALPGGKIAVNRGLLTELNNEAELAAVLSHEIVHAAARHGAKSMERGLLLQGALLISSALAQANDSDYAGVALGAASIGAKLISQRYSREQELEADRYGMTYMQRAGYDPRAAVGLQETFVKLSDGRNDNWLSGLFSTHPPSGERVAQNKKTATELAGGAARLGTDKYRRMTARLRRDKPAYEAYDEGQNLLKKYPAEALRLADTALAIVPGESLFYGLKGDALDSLKRDREAFEAYNTAVDLNPDYFLHRVRRGVLAFKQGNEQAAELDLHYSLGLLPTADANFLLGRILKRQGEAKGALSYFEAAAESDSDVGKLAWAEMARLDLADNPWRYLEISMRRDSSGYLLVQVNNPTPLAVRNLVLEVGKKNLIGMIRHGKKIQFEGVVEPGGVAEIGAPILGVVGDSKFYKYGAQILSAEVVL